MKKVWKFLALDFIPRNIDLGLLVLRIWAGGALFWLHGLSKLQGYSSMARKFPDPLGVGSQMSLSLAIFGEVVCPILLIIGFLPRLGALGSAITMAVAFFMAHSASLKPGPGSGELAFIFMAAFVALFVSGPGKYALDSNVARKSSDSGSSRPKKPSP